MKEITMRVTAAEVLHKLGAPLPGAGGFPPRPKLKAPGPGGPQGPPQVGPEMGDDAGAGAPPDFQGDEQAAQEQQGEQTLQGIVKRLGDTFSDQMVQTFTKDMTTLMKVVPPDHGEKLSTTFTKALEAIMSLKANITAIEILAMPAQQQQQLLQKNLQNLTQQQNAGPGGGMGGGGAPGMDQGIKLGPLT